MGTAKRDEIRREQNCTQVFSLPPGGSSLLVTLASGGPVGPTGGGISLECPVGFGLRTRAAVGGLATDAVAEFILGVIVVPVKALLVELLLTVAVIIATEDGPLTVATCRHDTLIGDQVVGRHVLFGADSGRPGAPVVGDHDGCHMIHARDSTEEFPGIGLAEVGHCTLQLIVTLRSG